jgi:hypothetical protein
VQPSDWCVIVVQYRRESPTRGSTYMQNNNINYLLNYEMIKMQGNFSGLAGNFHGKAVSVIKNELDKFANNL